MNIAVAQVLGFIHEVGNEHHRLTLCPDRPDQFPMWPCGLADLIRWSVHPEIRLPDR